MDRAILRVSAPIEVAAAAIARGVGDVWDDYVYLVDVKADNERLSYDNARLREQRSLARAGRRPRTGSSSACSSSRTRCRASHQRPGRRQGLHRVLPRHAHRARQGRARGPAAHARRLARRGRRRGAARRRRHASTCSSPSTPRSASTSRTSGRTRAASCAARATRRATVQGRDGRLARRGRDRRSPCDQRQGPVVSARASRWRASRRSSSASSAATRTSTPPRPSTFRGSTTCSSS